MSVVVDILVCLAFVVGTIALSLGAYFLMRFITGGDPDSRHKEMANAMIIRVAALHGLILALVFAHEMAGYQQLKTQSATEANAVADVYYDIARYDAELAPPLRGALIEYLNVVVDTEWPTLGATGRLAADAWANWDRAYGYVLTCSPFPSGRPACEITCWSGCTRYRRRAICARTAVPISSIVCSGSRRSRASS